MNDFIVVGADGKDYGPVSFSTLKEWVQDHRVNQTTVLKDSVSGQSMVAGTVPNLFAQMPPSSFDYAAPPQSASQDFSQYPRPGVPMGSGGMQNMGMRTGNGLLSGVIFRCVIAIVIAYFLSGLGFISAAYAAYYAFRLKQYDHKHANLMIGLVVVTFIVVTVFAFALPHRNI